MQDDRDKHQPRFREPRMVEDTGGKPQPGKAYQGKKPVQRPERVNDVNVPDDVDE